MVHGQIIICNGILLFLTLHLEIATTTDTPPPVTCPDLTAPANGQVVVNGMTPGDTATYSCDMGFELVGVDTVTCEDNGAWSSEPPVCIREF